MAKQKGAAKTGGRQTGTPNRTTEQLRQSFQEFINVNIDTLQTEFEKLEPEKKLAFFEKIIRHVLPPPTSFEKLSEDQLKQLHEYLIRKYDNEQAGKN